MPTKNNPHNKPRHIDDVANPISESKELKPEQKSPSKVIGRIQKSKTKVVALSRNRLVIIALVLLVIALTAIVLHFKNKKPVYDPVPISVRKSVNFDVYYPDPKKLPAGYTLNIKSFEASNQAVVYSVSYGNNQHFVFTDQKEPSPTSIQGFYKAHMPLTISVNTNVGTAQIGVLNNETVVSLPTNTNAWILMTAPLNASQQAVRQVIGSMTKAGS